ncbi:uncharacterized protein CC84DRAFT_1258387 [Paraphaeosphaeria sporulosa]|uniref:DUF7918 domain-containing protein n=1 Tax=Paraphaeosphaeria sporulosa TaxID=1460663 RepID=A0A177CJS2_9PLEO|nr:uncharacterized protein CC84DRAFT_1258387 [Paraphaeosphaeria sporulosa]OAG07222.1 hypothetical protein CC84DRAFT_1258387 [Paraphaeosphaeria sporulosa]
MAVIESAPGVQVQVVVDGNPLEEYDDPDSSRAPDAVTVYIEPISGKNFEIRTILDKHLPTGHDVSVLVSVDSVHVTGKHIPRHKIESSRISTVKGIIDIIGGAAIQSSFRFSDVQTFEGAASARKDAYKVLGQIEVQLHFSKNARKFWNRLDRIRSSGISQAAISAKHAGRESLSHRTSLDEPTKTKCSYWKTERVDEKAFSTFIFRYRSVQSLRSLQVISRSPPPTKAPAIEMPKSEHIDGTSSDRSPDPTSRPADPSRSPQGVWKALSDEDIKALLNHHTGQTSTRDGLRRTELEALLNHHRSTDEVIESGTTKIKRELDQGVDNDDFKVIGERKKKRKDVPGKDHRIIELD